MAFIDMDAPRHQRQLFARDGARHQLAGMARHGGRREAGNLGIGQAFGVLQALGETAYAAAQHQHRLGEVAAKMGVDGIRAIFDDISRVLAHGRPSGKDASLHGQGTAFLEQCQARVLSERRPFQRLDFRLARQFAQLRQLVRRALGGRERYGTEAVPVFVKTLLVQGPHSVADHLPEIFLSGAIL